MTYKIKNIDVKNLGPISELNWKLDNINLIFGNNEAGKSYIVEFLIHSIFKAKKWQDLREQKGRGKIELQIPDNKEKIFSPGSNKKLEDLLTQSKIGLPPDFSKLLVLRAANIGLGKADETDKLMLRRFLSHKELLEKIKEDIQEAVKTADISGYTIEGNRRGKIKEREEIKSKLEKIKNLFNDVEEKYLGGELYQLQEKKSKLEKKQKQFEQAKKYTAYHLNKEIEKFKQKSSDIDEEKLAQILTKISTWKQENKRLQQTQEELRNLRKKSLDYNWVVQALEEYQKIMQKKLNPKPQKLLFVVFIATFIFSGVFFTLGINFLGFASLAVSAFLGVFYKIVQDRYLIDLKKRNELFGLKKDFKKKFNQELNNLATLEEKKQIIEPYFQKRKVLNEQVEEEKRKLNNKKISLTEEIYSVFKQELEYSEWEKFISNKKQEKKDLNTKINEKEIELSRLNIEKTEYITKKPSVEFNPQKAEEMENKLDNIEKQINERKERLNRLKQSICDETDMIFSSSEWSELIEALANKKEKIEKEYKKITAQIIAEKKVVEVIKELFTEEDKKIEEVLKSDLIRDLLKQVTTRYNNIELIKDTLYVSDSFDSFPVSEISDGAREQVFLCLRIALASQWFKKEKLFLILDDAFIHSDSNRKQELVKNVINLGKNGWQIICLSFDERIKKLFDKNTKKYNFLNLNKLGKS